MRLGPLRFLVLVATGGLAWGASRVSVVATGVRDDVAAVARWRAGDQSPASPQIRYVFVERDPGMVPVPPLAAPLPAPVPPPGYRLVATGRDARDLVFDLPPGAAPPRLPARTIAVVAAAIPAAARATGGYASAAQAYDDLKRGDRRAAAAGFATALQLAPDDANAKAWRSELRSLRKRWSLEVYSLFRNPGTVGLGVAPVLGGGQSGATLAWTPNPLGKRPVAVQARLTTAYQGRGISPKGIDAAGSQAAFGVRWQVVPQASLSVERLFAIGAGGRGAWTARVAGGAAHAFGPVLIDGYAEAGVVGLKRRDLFAGVQARAVVPLRVAGLGLQPGVGLWSGIQHADTTASRVDLGPTLGVTRGRLNAAIDYRVRVAGNAEPGNGPAVTVSRKF